MSWPGVAGDNAASWDWFGQIIGRTDRYDFPQQGTTTTTKETNAPTRPVKEQLDWFT
jgi:hypothetical protein